MSKLYTKNSVVINQDVLNYFIGVLPDVVVGKNNAGRKTTVREEFSEIAKRIGKCKGMVKVHHLLLHPEDINLFTKNGTRLAYESCEQDVVSVSEYEEKIRKQFNDAAKKIIWFSSVCENYTGEKIVESYVNLASGKDCQQLVKAMSDFIDDADAMAEGYESVM